MRRLFVLTCLLAVLLAQGAGGGGEGVATANAAADQRERPPDDPARGVVHEGIRRSARTGPCRGGFELTEGRDRAGRPLCTHGPDPAPAGVDVRRRRDFLTAPPAEASAPVAPGVSAVAAAGARGAGNAARSGAAAATPSPLSGTAAAGSVACDGDGTSGKRVHVLYVRASDVGDRYATVAGNIRQWAANVDNVVNQSAAETGGSRRVRFVHDAGCTVVVTSVTLSASGDDTFTNTKNELVAKGFNRTDRKYLAFVDAYKYCGISQVYYDDKPTPDNYSNGHPDVPGELSRVDAGCWGQPASVEAHELIHVLGGVQTSAPHATSKNHCTDEYDRLCYNDGSGAALSVVCPSSHEALFDCRHDDYYSTAPAAGSYLATHWNTANNAFLIGAGTTGTTPTTTPATTTTTTAPPATTLPPATTTTVAPAGVPSAPRGLTARQPSRGGGVVLLWGAPASTGSGPLTGYRVYRGTSSRNMVVLTALGPATTDYLDVATTRGVVYYYQVSAVNGAGEGPRSNLTGMVAA
jgi:Fibronectin type III domain